MTVLGYPSSYPSNTGRRASHRSSARFFYLIDAIGRLHEPTTTQLDALESSYRSTGEFLSDCSEFNGLLHEIHAHGSRQLGTLVRPMDESREGYDIDLIARLRHAAMHKYEGPNGPVLLLNDLFAVLARYARAYGLRIHRWERCVTLEYENGMFADIAPVIDAPSNPRGYAKGFDRVAMISPNFTSKVEFAKALSMEARTDVLPLPDVQEVFDRLLSRLVQLLKLHRNVSFGLAAKGGNDVSKSSIFVTTLATVAYTVLAPQPHDSPLELLLDIVESLPDHFERTPLQDGSEYWSLANSSAPGENFAASMNTPARQAAFNSWHKRIKEHLTEIVDAIESSVGMDVLLAKLEVAFGKRAARAIRDDEARQFQGSIRFGKVSMLSAGASVATSARAHTFFGD